MRERISPDLLPAAAGELNAAIGVLVGVDPQPMPWNAAGPDPMPWRDKALAHLAGAAAHLGDGAPLANARAYAQGPPTPEPAIAAMTAFGKDFAEALNLLAAARADPANADLYRAGAEAALDRAVDDLAAARGRGLTVSRVMKTWRAAAVVTALVLALAGGAGPARAGTPPKVDPLACTAGGPTGSVTGAVVHQCPTS